MEKTPLSMRKHIAIVGKTNAGKSTLFNHFIGQNSAIVSPIEGTTTDANTKAMELIPYGPVALIDTAGLADQTALGKERTEKTMEILKRCDLLLYLSDATAPAESIDVNINTPYIKVYTKCDLLTEEERAALARKEAEAILIDQTPAGYERLRNRMVKELQKQMQENQTLLGDLLPSHSTVLLVTPIDDAAPKGRLIMPQVQVLRDCLDHDIKAVVTKENTLKEVLSEVNKIDLVVTDSQAFHMVNDIVPQDIPLTSFSMLLARQKGDFAEMKKGAETIPSLKENAKILVLEGCTHNTTHNDIGRKKIPSLLQKITGKTLRFTYCTGYQFPEDIRSYSLIISCGMCMINRQEVQSRINICRENKVPITNYGMVLAFGNGILHRACQIFGDKV